MSDRPIIKPEDAVAIVRTAPSQFTLSLLREWLAATAKRGPKYPPEAILDVPLDFRGTPPTTPGEGDWDVRWAPNWADVRSTTVGRFIANNFLFARNRALREAVPYIDKPWDGKVISGVEQTVIDAMLAGKITTQDVAWVVDRMQWLGYAPTNFLAPSMSIDTIRIPKSVRRLKEDILKSERGQRIRGGDLKELGATEKELIAAAESELKGKDPGFDIYASGARGNVGNNYKQVAVMRGAIRKSDDPSRITVSTASLEDGIPPDEVPAYADLMVQASYGRSMMTAQGGYIAKQLNAAFQSLSLDPDPESDCRTPLTLRVTIDDPREYLFRFYKDGGKLTEITPDLAPSLKGKVLQLRSPLYCGSKNGLCSRCAGKLHHRMGIQHVGLVTSRVGTSLMNASLKAFHDTSLKMKRVSLGDFTKEM